MEHERKMDTLKLLLTTGTPVLTPAEREKEKGWEREIETEGERESGHNMMLATYLALVE